MSSAKTKLIRAFTKIELLVLIVCVTVLAAIFLPVLSKAKARPSRVNCANNMKNIGIAFIVWGTDQNNHFPMQVSTTNDGTMELITNGDVFPHFLALSNELSTPKLLLCPMDIQRTEAFQFTAELSDTNISYFINVDALSGPSHILSGDRNLTNKAPGNNRLIPITKNSTIGWSDEIHSKRGNVVFADAHVESLSNKHAHEAIKIPEGVTHRLAVP